jgi:site-specific DNA-methyltransferase (adenine-specific)
MTLVLTECLRLARPGTPLLVFSDYRQVPINSDALQAAGWAWRGIVPWHKPIARPAKGGFRRSCEYILWATNGPIDAARNPVYLDGIVTGSQPRGTDRLHITQKPLAIMRDLVKVCAPGGTVLDPFAGSGTTGAAAVIEGRSFIGFDLSEEYIAVARERLMAAA